MKCERPKRDGAAMLGLYVDLPERLLFIILNFENPITFSIGILFYKFSLANIFPRSFWKEPQKFTLDFRDCILESDD